MMKGISLVLAALLMTSAASAKMTTAEVSYMQATIAKEQDKINAQQVFVSKIQTELAAKQQTHAVKTGAYRAAQWTTLPIAAFELGRLGYALAHEGYRVAQFVFFSEKVAGTKINVRKQVIIAATAMAAYYGSDVFKNEYLVVETKNIGQLQGQLSKALAILEARQVALGNMQKFLNEQL